MKAYEGKNFAFIRASYWLLMLYANYEGKLNFKQMNVECEKEFFPLQFYSVNQIIHAL